MNFYDGNARLNFILRSRLYGKRYGKKSKFINLPSKRRSHLYLCLAKKGSITALTIPILVEVKKETNMQRLDVASLCLNLAQTRVVAAPYRFMVMHASLLHIMRSTSYSLATFLFKSSPLLFKSKSCVH
jgi:hypothetical protein